MFAALLLVVACLAATSQGAHLSAQDECISLLHSDARASVASPSRSLTGIVGVGFDALTSTHTAPVLPLKHDACSTTPDGAFFVPDNVLALPLQQTDYEMKADYYDSYELYFKQNTLTINSGSSANGSYKGVTGSIGASYSKTNQQTKQTMHEYSSSLLHTSMRHVAYTLVTDGAAALHPDFSRRLMEVAAAQAANLTIRARFLAELIVRDYGTHYVSSADVGAVYEREDYVDSNLRAKNTTSFNQLRTDASASLSLAGFFSVGSSFSRDKSTLEQTQQRISQTTKHSLVRSRGGPSASRLASDKGARLDEGDFLLDNLVPLDVRGELLFRLVQSSHLPDLPVFQVDALRMLMISVTDEYYTRNTVPGCMQGSAKNFNFNANIDDGSCVAATDKFSFGGMFQTCKILPGDCAQPSTNCDGYNQPNFATGGNTCGAGEETVKLLTTRISLPDRQEQRVQKKKKWFHTKTTYYYVTCKDHVEVEIYWCRKPPTAKQDEGVMFGGLFTSGQPNQITNENGCPGRYRAFPLLRTNTVCMSRDYQLDGMYAAVLQSFFSCQSPAKDQGCAKGYSQHFFFASEQQCEVYYCVRNEAFIKIIPALVKRPPFVDALLAASTAAASQIAVFEDNELVHTQNLAEILTNKTLIHLAVGENELIQTAARDSFNEQLEAWIKEFDKKLDEDQERKIAMSEKFAKEELMRRRGISEHKL